jgi:hypothetical protein
MQFRVYGRLAYRKLKILHIGEVLFYAFVTDFDILVMRYQTQKLFAAPKLIFGVTALNFK